MLRRRGMAWHVDTVQCADDYGNAGFGRATSGGTGRGGAGIGGAGREWGTMDGFPLLSTMPLFDRWRVASSFSGVRGVPS